MQGIAIIPRTSANLTVTGSTVTAPPGRYMTKAEKSVPEGSATTPATVVTATPSISVSNEGLITATTSTTKSITPTISEGYVTTGTSGVVTVSGSNTKQLDVMTLPTSAASSASGTTKATISRSTSAQYINIPTGFNTTAANYKINAVANGSATTPATTISATPSISVNSSTGVITASASATKSVTPTVNAGYVSSGTAGTITVSGSNTSQLTTKAATTYNTSTSNQTIAAGTYLTGAQTIRAVTTSGISAENIKEGVTIKVGDSANAGRIKNVTGTLKAGDTEISGSYSYSENGPIVTNAARIGWWGYGRQLLKSVGDSYLLGIGNTTTITYAQSQSYGNPKMLVIDSSLTVTTTESPGWTSRYDDTGWPTRGTNFNGLLILAGGYNYGNYHYGSSSVIVFNSSLTKSEWTSLSKGRRNPGVAATSSHCIVGGGEYYNNYTNTVDAYDTSGTKSVATALPAGVEGPAGATVNNYALISGGYTVDSYGYYVSSSSTVSYDTSLTQSRLTNRTTGLSSSSPNVGAMLPSYAMFASSGSGVSTYDSSFTMLNFSLSYSLLIKNVTDNAVVSWGNAVYFGESNSENATITSVNTSLTQSSITGHYSDFGHVGPYLVSVNYNKSSNSTTQGQITYNQATPQLKINLNSVLNISPSGSSSGSMNFS